MKSFVNKVIIRDLENLKRDIQSNINTSQLWNLKGGINNSTGNLILHICGNLRHFIGNILGNTGYKREREKEFINNYMTISELTDLLDTTIKEVSRTLESMEGNDLTANYPIEIAGNRMANDEALIYLVSHLGYHVGQINYLQRILQNDHND